MRLTYLLLLFFTGMAFSKVGPPPKIITKNGLDVTAYCGDIFVEDKVINLIKDGCHSKLDSDWHYISKLIEFENLWALSNKYEIWMIDKNYNSVLMSIENVPYFVLLEAYVKPAIALHEIIEDGEISGFESIKKYLPDQVSTYLADKILIQKEVNTYIVRFPSEVFEF